MISPPLPFSAAPPPQRGAFRRHGFRIANAFVTILSRNGGAFVLILRESRRKHRHFHPHPAGLLPLKL
jgi:hypothetical protein